MINRPPFVLHHPLSETYGLRAGLVVVLLALVASVVPSPATAQDLFDIENVFPNVAFERAVDLAFDGLGSVYVVEQRGKIYTFPNDSTTADTTLFLDLSDRIHYGPEAGLLSLTFHPDYEENGYAYVYYVTDDPLRSILSRFQVSASDPRRLDLESEEIFLEIPQPTERHNAGGTQFGPDGYFYLSLGDGSLGPDTYENGQDPRTLLGSILRIDVDHPDGDRPYSIPPDNPFVGNTSGYREEIYAYGLRNPWRFSIDMETGHLWAGDVGAERLEEVNFIVSGGNYGWNLLEGTLCFDPPASCPTGGTLPPVYEYNHDVGVAVTGGFVYRGARVPALVGTYIFADWSSKHVWAISYEENPYQAPEPPSVSEIAEAEGFISSFAVDGDGELYMLYTFKGTVMRFAETETETPTPEPPPQPSFAFAVDGPNPFTNRTTVRLETEEEGDARVAVYDVLGRRVRELLNESLPAGSVRELEFDAGTLSSGVYFIRAETVDAVRTESVILAR